MISRWKWMLKQTFKKLWFRATLFAIVAIITALLSILFKSMIPESVSVKVGAEAVDNILNILASSMLAVTTFSLSIMVTAYGSATTNVTPRATRLVVEDVTTQNVLATFIGSFLFSLVGIIALNMGAYGERGRVILFIVNQHKQTHRCSGNPCHLRQNRCDKGVSRKRACIRQHRNQRAGQQLTVKQHADILHC